MKNLYRPARAALHTSRLPIIPPTVAAPFVCLHCRRATSQPRIAPPPSRRLLSTSHRTLEQSTSTSTPTDQQEPTPPQTHYDFFPETFPHGPPPASPFTPDLRRLRREYLRLQAKAHPDTVPPSQKRRAEATSSRINEAYKAIQDPLKRAQYLLSLQGIDVEDESAKLGESELLMEVMEAREAVEEVEGEEELVGLREENERRIGESVGVLEEAFASGERERAAKEAVRLRYWMNIEESIQGWEKGKGGGLIHH